MPKCWVCGSRAVARIPYLGLHLCETHFSEYFERRFLETIERMSMVRRGERVAVAVSGGKDSLTLLYLFSKYRRKLGVEVIGIAVDEGIKWYRELKLEALKGYAKSWEVELRIESFKARFGFTLDEAVKALMEVGLVLKPCSICGVLRRYLLNETALKVGADKLATAHNMDDEVQVFLMNLIRANLGSLGREGATTRVVHKALVPRVKPFYFTREKEVAAYALLQGIESPIVECPYVVYSARHVIRRWLNVVEMEDEHVKYRILALKELLSSTSGRVCEGLTTCQVCGMPSSQSICRACLFSSYVRSILGQRHNSF